MLNRKILIGVDFSSDNYVELKFALDYFNVENNLLVMLYGEDQSNKQNLIDFRKRIKSTRNIKGVLADLLRMDSGITASVNLLSTNDDVSEQCKYADLFVCSRSSFENDHLRSFDLEKEESLKTCCTLLVVPDDYTTVKNVVLVYDGTNESLYAIKQFCRVLPQACRSLDVVLLFLARDNHSVELEQEHKLFVNYLQQHCQRLAVHYYSGEDRNQLEMMLDIKDETLFVAKRLLNSRLNVIEDSSNIMEIFEIN